MNVLRERPCTIAYIGASVTAQRDGYRPRLHTMICESTGHAHRAVNAALGATGAITGVCLLDERVLAHHPDIAFVEYATGDVADKTPPGELVAVLEGIVGKLRAAGCEPCFLYMHRSDLDLPHSDVVAAYEDVARHHHVPSIDVGPVPLRDAVHTTPKGSVRAAERIHAALPSLAPGPAAPVRDDSYLSARVDPPGDTTGVFRLVQPYAEAETLRVTPSGELIGLLVVLGPESSALELAYDGQTDTVMLWDEDCTYERLGSVVLPRFVPAGTEVTLRGRIKLAGLLVR